MFFVFRVLLLALVIGFGTSIGLRAGDDAASAQSGGDASLSGDLLKDWEALKGTMMALGEEMPPDKFDFKPTPDVRSYGEQLMHVAGANLGLMKLLDSQATAPTLPESPTAKADILKALADSFDFGTAILKAQTDASLQATVQGPRFLGPSTGARIVYRTMIHTWDEYGVMTVYLRLNGLVPPASQ